MNFLTNLLSKYRALPDGIRLAIFGGGVGLLIWLFLKSFMWVLIAGAAAFGWHYFREKGVFGGENKLDIFKGPEESKEADEEAGK